MSIFLKDYALEFASKQHKDQKRKYSGEPYIVHPIAVAKIIIDAGFKHEETIAAAYLHDVVEDTDCSIQKIQEHFGDTVAELVWYLTDFNNLKEGNRKTRKLITCWRLSGAPLGAKIIKLADLIDNTKDIEQGDPKFAKVYKEEKKSLIKVIEESTTDLDHYTDHEFQKLIAKAKEGLK